MSGVLQAADPASKVAYTFTNVDALAHAIQDYGFIPLRTDGSVANTQFLKEYGGYLIDGAPINVWIDGVWLEGQKEAMAPYWNNGSVPRPPDAILNAPIEGMPPELAAQTAAYQAKQSGIFGMDTGTLLVLGTGIMAIWWIGSR